MNAQALTLRMGQVLFAGLLLSLFFTALGGIGYLLEHHNTVIDYSHFTPAPFSSSTMIQWGFFILLATQCVRLMITALIFHQLHDNVFVKISLLVLAIVLYSMCLV